MESSGQVDGEAKHDEDDAEHARLPIPMPLFFHIPS